MRLTIGSRDIALSPELKEFIRRRAHFSFGRFAGRIRTVSIRLADANGPRGGVDKRCDIHIDTGLPKRVIVRELQAGVHAAIAFAAERAGQALRRQFGAAIAVRRPAF